MTQPKWRLCPKTAFAAVPFLMAAWPAMATTPAPPEHWTRVFAGPMFFGMFVLPVLILGLAIAAAVALVRHLNRSEPTPHPLWAWPILAGCTAPIVAMTNRDVAGFLVFWPAIALAILLWHYAERRQSRAGLLLANKGARVFGLSAAAFVMWQAGQALAKLSLVVSLADAPPGPGTPPFAREFDGTKYAHPMTTPYRLALWRFPDQKSCLKQGADTATAAGLAQMDWDQISSSEEAEVCLFRLISGLPNGMADFTAFAEAQGFGVSKNSFNPTNPYVERDRSLRVSSSWSLRQNGPKFPTHGLSQIFSASAYGMGVDATFAPDGRSLRYIAIFFNTE